MSFAIGLSVGAWIIIALGHRSRAYLAWAIACTVLAVILVVARRG